ncbi:MAG: OmpA family protein [Muribaculaceae bacterium]|nr:OmpA family protein [Muribaculaceae bacterium]
MRYLLFSLILAITVIPSVAKGGWTDPYKNYDETLFMDMDLEQNLLTPDVPDKEHAAVNRYMKRVGTNLSKRGYTVDMMRDDEVVLVTIPTDQLFFPNDTLLSPEAPGKLKPITDLLAVPDRYKVVYAVHTDNTGSERYNMDLSHRRNNSIYDWLLGHVSEDVILIPYEMGDTDPIEPNTSRKGRAENRRLEIYLVPGPKLITEAHKGLLK